MIPIPTPLQLWMMMKTMRWGNQMFSIKIVGNYESLWTNFLSALIATKYRQWMVFIHTLCVFFMRNQMHSNGFSFTMDLVMSCRSQLGSVEESRVQLRSLIYWKVSLKGITKLSLKAYLWFDFDYASNFNHVQTQDQKQPRYKLFTGPSSSTRFVTAKRFLKK